MRRSSTLPGEFQPPSLMKPPRRNSKKSLTISNVVAAKRTSLEMNRDFGRRHSMATLDDASAAQPQVSRRSSLPALDDASALAGAAGLSLIKMKKANVWDLHGRKTVSEVPLTEEELLRELERQKEKDMEKKPRLSPVVRSGFHRLVYQKLRLMRENENEEEHKSFETVARDVLHSVRICMHCTDMGRQLKNRRRGVAEEETNDEKSQPVAGQSEINLDYASDEYIDNEGQEMVDNQWKLLMGDLDLSLDTSCGSKHSMFSIDKITPIGPFLANVGYKKKQIPSPKKSPKETTRSEQPNEESDVILGV